MNIIAYPVILLAIYLMRRSGNYLDILLAFWFVLILSDSLEPFLDFAKQAKHLVMVVFAGLMILDRRYFMPDYRLMKWLLPFFIIAAIAMMFSPDIVISLQKTLSYFLLYLAVPAYLMFAYREEGPIVFRKIILFAVSILLLGIVLKYAAPEVALLEGRFRGVFGNPNGIGVFVLIFFLLFQVVRSYFPDLFTKREVIFFYFVIALNIYWCGSRNALISVLIFLIFFRLYKIVPALGFFVFILIVVLYQVISSNIVEIIVALNLQEYFRIQTMETGSGRYVAWIFAWEQLQEYFFLGRGFANDELTMRPNYAYLSKLGHQGGVHNSYISLWMDVGLLGVLAYFVPFFIIFVRAAKNSRVAMPVMYALLFTMIFESWLVGSQNPVTIQLVMIFTVLFYISPQMPGQPVILENYEQTDSNLRRISGRPVA